MGYFSNGSEGSSYEAQYCARCVHRNGPDGTSGCAVMLAHILYAYKECGEGSHAEEILSLLIPRGEIWNEQCGMFHECTAVADPSEAISVMPAIPVMPAMREWAEKHGITTA